MLKRNTIANLLGKVAAAFCAFAFVPLYLRLLGPEAYGLIGLAASIQVIIFLLDLGFSSAFTREIARMSTHPALRGSMRDLCRTFEVVFWSGGLLIAAAVFLASGFIANHWLHPQHLALPMIVVCVVFMGANAGLQFPFLLYQGGLLGLQKQVPMNIANAITAGVRGAGAVAVIAWLHRSVDSFFLWQVAVSLTQVVVAAALMWHSLPRGSQPAVRVSLLQPLWRFAMGMAGISVSGILLMQLDRIVLSKIVSLQDLGYYTLSALPGTVPVIIAASVQSAVYPRMNQMLASNDLSGLMSLYRRASQFVAIPAVSVGLLFAFFPREVMLLWTHNSSTADNTQDLVRILVTGSTLGALMFIPYTLQLVFGFTRLLLLFNCASVVVLVPTTVLLVRSFGMPGAAFVSIILYSCQISFLIPLMHRRSLLSEARSWYLHGLLTPCLVTAAILVLAKSVIPPGLGNLPFTMILVLLLATTMLATLLMAPQARFAVLSSANGLFDVTRARRGIRRNRGDR